jgi:hypothetical protein
LGLLDLIVQATQYRFGEFGIVILHKVETDTRPLRKTPLVKAFVKKVPIIAKVSLFDNQDIKYRRGLNMLEISQGGAEIIAECEWQHAGQNLPHSKVRQPTLTAPAVHVYAQLRCST